MKIGDVVFLLGRYTPCGETVIVEAKIDHIQHRQFVAYTVDGPGEWHFSRRHIGKSAFPTLGEAEAALGKEGGQDGEK